MEVIFCRNKKVGSLLIRFFTWSQWSHCGVIDGAYVIHATAGKGVVRELLADVQARYEYKICHMAGDSKRALALVGKKYDFGGVFGHYGGFWDNKDRWFCSELVAHCSDQFRRSVSSRVTPQHCYMVSEDVI